MLNDSYIKTDEEFIELAAYFQNEVTDQLFLDKVCEESKLKYGDPEYGKPEDFVELCLIDCLQDKDYNIALLKMKLYAAENRRKVSELWPRIKQREQELLNEACNKKPCG